MHSISKLILLLGLLGLGQPLSIAESNDEKCSDDCLREGYCRDLPPLDGRGLETVQQCYDFCQTYETCKFYNFYTVGKNCFLLTRCEQYDPSAEDVVTGARDCKPC